MNIDIDQQVGELLNRFPDLRLAPTVEKHVLRLITGVLSFEATDEHGNNHLDGTFQIDLLVPTDLPRSPPRVKETGGRIPSDFHRFSDDQTLCLGSPLRLRVELHRRPSLLGFVETCVLPYFYGFLRNQQDGQMPFDELEHGARGLLDDYRRLLGAPSDQACIRMLEILSLRKRVANKLPCPCGSDKRVGQCHHHRLNAIRQVAPLSWFREAARGLKLSLARNP